jgi:hypothetical protein
MYLKIVTQDSKYTIAQGLLEKRSLISVSPIPVPPAVEALKLDKLVNRFADDEVTLLDVSGLALAPLVVSVHQDGDGDGANSGQVDKGGTVTLIAHGYGARQEDLKNQTLVFELIYYSSALPTFIYMFNLVRH